jgi:hypothetical protein
MFLAIVLAFIRHVPGDSLLLGYQWNFNQIAANVVKLSSYMAIT